MILTPVENLIIAVPFALFIGLLYWRAFTGRSIYTGEFRGTTFRCLKCGARFPQGTQIKHLRSKHADEYVTVRIVGA